jgi:hypothetical protein
MTRSSPQTVRKKSRGDRSSPTTSNDVRGAFPQVRACFSVPTNGDREQPKPRVIVPFQRLTEAVAPPAVCSAGSGILRP